VGRQRARLLDEVKNDARKIGIRRWWTEKSGGCPYRKPRLLTSCRADAGDKLTNKKSTDKSRYSEANSTLN
jgi:hypothetical protein